MEFPSDTCLKDRKWHKITEISQPWWIFSKLRRLIRHSHKEATFFLDPNVQVWDFKALMETKCWKAYVKISYFHYFHGKQFWHTTEFFFGYHNSPMILLFLTNVSSSLKCSTCFKKLYLPFERLYNQFIPFFSIISDTWASI